MRRSIGIVIPVFNRPRQILRALDSVLAQTLPPRQLIVVDDGSTDGTARAMASWADERSLPFDMHVIHQTNQGAAAARNAGFAALDGCTEVLFLDSDDRLPPDLLARAGQALQAAPDAILALADLVQVNEAEQRFRTTQAALIAAHPLRHMFALGSAFLSSSLMRCDFVRRAGPFPVDFRTGEDTIFLCRLALLGRWIALPGSPVLQGHNLLLSGTEAGHLSRSAPDRFLSWARMHEAIFREVRPALGPPDRFVLRRSIGGRYFNAAQAAKRGGQTGEAATHLLRAFYHLAVACLERVTPAAARPSR